MTTNEKLYAALKLIRETQGKNADDLLCSLMAFIDSAETVEDALRDFAGE